MSTEHALCIPIGAWSRDRRHGDRRARPTPMLSRHTWVGGRRRAGRREGETACTFVDLHGPGLFLVALSVVALNMLDAWFTVLFLSHGGRELNPLVQKVLELGTPAFIAFKTLGIGTGVAFLALTKNFRAARIGMTAVLLGYVLLLGWHLFLLLHLPH